ncbi:MAG: DUF4129 domain-containing protein [Betaproteobacteria bacterium]|nr:MAG: DUF4129 domain-containing protein [Betaproteobacteria bacterium]
MELERMVVGVRPRSGWESLDLGFQMARQWWRQVWGIWFTLYLPIAIVAMAVFPNKFYAVLLLWWLKPLFDRAILYALSRLVFSERSGVREALRAARDWMRPGLFLALTLRRFELARSFQLPVAALEKQNGKSAQQRRAVLGSRMRGTAVWLTVVCLHFEFIAMGALFALGNMLVPSAGEIPEDGGSSGDGFDFSDLMSWNLVDAVCYAGAVSLIEPFYVAAGFSLYLNRRTILEGWDMEIRLRQLGNRLRSAASAATAVLLCGFLMIGSPSNTTHAAAAGPDAAEEIERILDSPDFDQYREVTRWRSLEKKKEKDKQEPRFDQFWRNLALLISDMSQGLMWVAIAILVPLLLYVLRNFLPEHFTPKSEKYEPPANLFGLNVTPESLPADVSAAATQLARAGRLREALSLLYRGALSELIHRYRVVVHAGDTEGDCTEAALRALDKPGAEYFTGLVGTWQQLAYGSTPPQLGEVDALCRDWALHFDTAESPLEAQRS